jgi:actin-like ATPase involved in cell morphogenesis
VVSQSLRVGGDGMATSEGYKLLIGQQTAEEIKLGRLRLPDERVQAEVRGRDSSPDCPRP